MVDLQVLCMAPGWPGLSRFVLAPCAAPTESTDHSSPRSTLSKFCSFPVLTMKMVRFNSARIQSNFLMVTRSPWAFFRNPHSMVPSNLSCSFTVIAGGRGLAHTIAQKMSIDCLINIYFLFCRKIYSPHTFGSPCSKSFHWNLNLPLLVNMAIGAGRRGVGLLLLLFRCLFTFGFVYFGLCA